VTLRTGRTSGGRRSSTSIPRDWHAPFIDIGQQSYGARQPAAERRLHSGTRGSRRFSSTSIRSTKSGMAQTKAITNGKRKHSRLPDTILIEPVVSHARHIEVRCPFNVGSSGRHSFCSFLPSR
jgi:hypothetical protein